MKCKNCGEELRNDSKFCIYCGAKVKTDGLLLWLICSIVILIIVILPVSFLLPKTDIDTECFNACQTVDDYRSYMADFGRKGKHYSEAQIKVKHFETDSITKSINEIEKKLNIKRQTQSSKKNQHRNNEKEFLWEEIPIEIVLDEEMEEVEEEIFSVVENDPEFPGGMEALYKYLASNIKYPNLAKENNITGRVYVTFVVEKDGSIANPRILRDIGGGCGAEAIRVVKSMPKWKPGKQRGKAVRVQFNLPVSFNLQ